MYIQCIAGPVHLEYGDGGAVQGALRTLPENYRHQATRDSKHFKYNIVHFIKPYRDPVLDLGKVL